MRRDRRLDRIGLLATLRSASLAALRTPTVGLYRHRGCMARDILTIRRGAGRQGRLPVCSA
jgi:hypothetical protein